MSQENVEVVRKIYEAQQRDDEHGVGQFVSPDVELHGTRGGLSEGGVAAVLFELRDGRVTRMQGFMDQADALRVAELAE